MSGEGLLASSGRPQLADPVTVGRIAELLGMTLGRHHRRDRKDRPIDFEDPALELRADLRADDIDMVAIAVDMEEAFSIELPDPVLDRVRTIGDLQCVAIGRDF